VVLKGQVDKLLIVMIGCWAVTDCLPTLYRLLFNLPVS